MIVDLIGYDLLGNDNGQASWSWNVEITKKFYLIYFM